MERWMTASSRKPSNLDTPPERARPGNRLSRNRRWIVLGVASLFVVGAVVATFAVREALAMRRDLLRAEAAFDEAVALTDPLLADFGSFRQTSESLNASAVHLAAADDALASAERHRNRIAPLLSAAALIPGWTRGLNDVPPLIAAGRDLARAGIELSDGFSEMSARIDVADAQGETSGRRLTAGLTVAEPAFGRALAAIESARENRDSVDTAEFGGPLGAANNALATFDKRMEPLHDNAVLVAQLPAAARAVLGIDGPRTYAILGQNSAELRPTGGFIGSLGVITLENGEITKQDYSSVYLLEDRTRGYLPAPAPIARYLGGATPYEVGWGIRDANWSPDFPTSARTLEWMLLHHRDLKVDGVIGFTTYAVGGLIDTLGPLNVPGIDQPMTSASWYQLAETAIYGEQAGVRPIAGSQENKGEVLGEVLNTIVARIQAANQEELPKLLRTLQSLVERREILVSFHDEAPAELARRYEASGVFAPPETGDVLGLIDANLSYSKVGPYIDETIEYDVWLTESGLPERSRVTVSYTNRITNEQSRDPGRRVGGQEFDPQTGKFVSVPGLYGTYARVYIPENSRLTGVEPAGAEVVTTPELGFLSIEHYESIPAEGSRSFSYEYQIPPERQEPGVYRLTVIKQPGTPAHTLIVRVHPAAGTVATPSRPMAEDGDALVYKGTLDKNLELTVTVEQP
jgi:hypothetical protein